MSGIPVQFGGLAKQDGHGNINRLIAQQGVIKQEMFLFGGNAYNGMKAMFALTKSIKQRQ